MRRVTIGGDPSIAAGCRMVKTLNLSGRTETDGEANRDGILEGIAADAGGDTVLILERTPDFVRGTIYQCRDRPPKALAVR